MANTAIEVMYMPHAFLFAAVLSVTTSSIVQLDKPIILPKLEAIYFSVWAVCLVFIALRKKAFLLSAPMYAIMGLLVILVQQSLVMCIKCVESFKQMSTCSFTLK